MIWLICEKCQRAVGALYWYKGRKLCADCVPG